MPGAEVMDFNSECEKKLNERPETRPPCGEKHCTSVQESEYYHASCEGRAVYSPVQTLGCYNTANGTWEWKPPTQIKARCKELAKEDPNWELEQCFCCCSCFANLTPIGLPEGKQLPIGEIDVGDQVMVGRTSGDEVTWSPAVVQFSQGTEEGHQPAMTYIVYGDGQEMIASPDQPLMLADGSLTTAGKLTPDQELMGIDGKPVPVSLVSLGGYDGGVHHISTDTEWDGSIDDHLIQANGVVAGDFTLQVHFSQIPSTEKATEWGSLPEIGTAEYADSNQRLTQLGDVEVYAADDSEIDFGETPFTPYGAATDMPLETKTFVTPAQAADILAKGHQEPVTEQSGYSLAEEAINLIRGFYPEFVYYIDWNRAEPNVYAFEQYGEKVILLSGGLVRMRGLGFNAIAMAVGHGVGRFLAGAPRETETFSCTGEADLYAFGAVSRKIWFGKYWLKQGLDAEDQLSELFALIQPKHAKPNPHNICGEPGVSCREEAWIIGLSGGSLPPCAGGPPLEPLVLEKASATETGGVQLVFSQTLDAQGAETPTNYELAPEGSVIKATINAKKDFIVDLQVEVPKPGKYTLTVGGLQSIYGGEIKPDPTSIEVEL